MPHEQPQETEPAADTPTREQRLEAALRIIKEWAASGFPDPRCRDIEDKCREALTTGEGE